MRQVFDDLDADHSGYISKTEIQGFTHSEEQTRETLEHYDINEDGKVSYLEFLIVWKFQTFP